VGQDQKSRQERRHRNEIRDANSDCHGGQDQDAGYHGADDGYGIQD